VSATLLDMALLIPENSPKFPVPISRKFHVKAGLLPVLRDEIGG
jgi:hypothetical protein